MSFFEDKVRDLHWQDKQDQRRAQAKADLAKIEAEHREETRKQQEENFIIEFQPQELTTSKVDVTEKPKPIDPQIKKNPKNQFDKRLEVLKNWMEVNGFKEGATLPKHYTVEKMYKNLANVNGDLFNSIEFNSFERHFWAKQKICELTRGPKSTIL
ncbi:hypothetical protein CWO84_14815 [Methylomonas sp. Kb3]|uniref:hypothetical protein n=1 Tax=Methylomonas sp. Kb3 TaxID=1611544 RepID=UPI000C327EE1|nr:hypothetical protein [Methylomonas sp. Kb3]PKD39571.1 hypothetical protein CWO84_14815 [Methylomonas sp. Kb3]